MISIRNLSKVYKVYDRRSDRLKEWLSLGRKNRHREYWALKNLNLQVAEGLVYGIIGMNGAGKSTLLKILTGTTHKTSGTITMKGRVAALLELGTGFHHELTGRENVRINGKLLGLSDEQLRERMPAIKEFSELGDFFDEPVRTYSSGMYVRLAFSMAASVSPDILIIDEALSVGDAYFQQKCIARLEQFKREGTTILFVSHDPGVVTKLCDEVALLDKGKIVHTGSAQECLEIYNALLAKKEGHGSEYVIEKHPDGKLVSGNKKASISKVALFNQADQPLEALTAGEMARLVVEVKFNDPIENPTVGILIRDRLGYDIFGTNTAQLSVQSGSFKPGDRARFVFNFGMNLGPGAYTVSAAVHSSFTHIEDCYEWVDRVLSFNVLARADFHFLGVSMLSPKLSIEPIKT